MKLLLLVAIGLVVVIWLTRSKKTAVSKADTRADHSGNNSERIEPIVQCAHCGVHVPASEALTSPAGVVFCSDEHRLLHGRP
jgi:uncharacterized protein